MWRGGGSQPLPESGGRAEPRPEGGHGGAGHGDHQPDPGAGAPPGARALLHLCPGKLRPSLT